MAFVGPCLDIFLIYMAKISFLWWDVFSQLAILRVIDQYQRHNIQYIDPNINKIGMLGSKSILFYKTQMIHTQTLNF